MWSCAEKRPWHDTTKLQGYQAPLQVLLQVLHSVLQSHALASTAAQ